MLRSPRLSRTRPVAVALVVAASVMLLSGCTGETPAPEKTTTPPPPASESPTASAEPTATPEPAVPFAIECDALLTPDQVYAFNPNFGTAPDFEASGEHMVAVVDDEAGTACGWLNQTSGEVIEVGVATPPPAALLARRSDAALDSTPVPTYGTPPEIEGYFTQASGNGEVQVFSGPYWIVIRSAALFEPGDAGQLVSDVLANLPAA